MNIHNQNVKKKNVYCICKQDQNNMKMVSCDGPCQDQYHINCVGMSETEFENITKIEKSWYCPLCQMLEV